MAITKGLDVSAIASATSVTVKQKINKMRRIYAPKKSFV